ncbi:EAL domain-containing protein [Aliikangiella sp. IMCC44653]
MFQQKNGLIWFATDKGAVCYDGEFFKQFNYSPGTANHISNNYVTAIEEDANGNIWLATEDGLNKITFDGNNRVFKKGSNGLDIKTSWFTAIFLDSNEQLWVGSSEGVFLYVAAKDYFELVKSQDTSASNISVESFYQHSDGTLFIGASNGLYKLNSDKSLLEPAFFTDEQQRYKSAIYSMIDSSPDSILLGTEDTGVLEYHFKTGSISPFVVSNNPMDLAKTTVTDLVRDDKGRLWIGHYNHGVSLIDQERKLLKNFQYKAFDDLSLPSNTISDVFIDKSGLIWIASTGGISSISPLRFAINVYKQIAGGGGLSTNSIYSMYYDGEETLWSGGDAGLNALNISSKKINSYQLVNSQGELFAHQTVWHIQAAQAGYLWLTTEKGLLLFDMKSGRSENVTQNIPALSGELYTIMPGDNNSIWLTGYRDVGLTLFNQDQGIVKRFLHTATSPYFNGGNFTMDKLISSTGDIWLATTDGLIRVNPISESISYHPLSKDKSYIRATSIVEDHNRNIWVTSQGAGLVKVIPSANDVAMEFFQTESGISENELMSLSLKENNLWITSYNKLYKFNLETELAQQYPSIFIEKDLNFMESASTIIGDRLFLGTNRGLIEVDTKNLLTNQFKPNVIISEVMSDNISLLEISSNASSDNLNVAYKNNDIDFKYAALDYNNPKNNLYQYQLVGHDDEWSLPTSENSVRYTNLAPGNYLFRVRGSNSDAVWSESEARFSFEIERPWWHYVILSLVATVILVGIFYILDRRKQWKKLYSRAHTDSLTGLANRYSFTQVLEQEFTYKNNEFALILIDLDGFKQVNDSFGHQVGDLLLGTVSTRLKECCRKGDSIARLGGDEFAVIVRDQKLQGCLVDIAERIRTALCKNFDLGNKKIAISSSIGVAVYPEDAKSESELMTRADAAMYFAKQRGRNNVAFYNSELNTLLNHRVKIRAYLKQALELDEMTVFYQPKVNQLTGMVIGFEALLRWQCKKQGWISPEEFIPEAENNGQIVPIGLWVLEQACDQINAWESAYKLPDDFRVSINVSPVQLMQSSFESDFEAIVKQYGVALTRIELEITESILIQNRRHCQSVIISLRGKGVSIALDDFGVGFSALSYLTKFPINILKIDRSFIVDIETSFQNQIVLRHVFALAEELKIKVVVEGVESQAQLDILRQLKGFFIQGYYFSKPLNANKASEYLQNSLNNIKTIERQLN